MAANSTNGESARKWLKENKERITEQRIVQIRGNLEKKINQLTQANTPDDPELSDEHQGLLEALDVMDAWLQEHSLPVSNKAVSESSESAALDYSPLIQESAEPIVQLSPQEKRRQFQMLLKANKQ